MSTIMKRAGGATPSRRSAAARPPLRMFEVDQPRCVGDRLRGGLRGVVGQVGGERLALVAGVVEDHAALRRLRPVPWLSCLRVDLQGDDVDLAVAVALTAAPAATPSEPREARAARSGRARRSAMLARLIAFEQPIVRQRRGQLVAGRRVARALDHQPVVLHHLDLGRVDDAGRAPSVRVDARPAAPAPACRGMVARSVPRPPGVEHRRAGAGRRGAGCRSAGVRQLAARKEREPLRLAGRAARRCPAGSRATASARLAGGDELGVARTSRPAAPRRRRARGRGEREREALSGAGRERGVRVRIDHGPHLNTKPDGPTRRRWPMLFCTWSPARVALEAAEQDALEVVRRHEAVDRRRDRAGPRSG